MTNAYLVKFVSPTSSPDDPFGRQLHMEAIELVAIADSVADVDRIVSHAWPLARIEEIRRVRNGYVMDTTPTKETAK